jgi:two-component system, OmpR family, KDP operon response regulator KdpE
MDIETAECESGTVLIVDDDEAMRRALRTTLSSLGFRVVEAARGEEAVTLIRVTRFDAVLLDVDMPGMGGVEACRSIRRTAPNLPILMLTVMDSEDDKVLALDSGADDYITKPFQLRETIARLRSAVRRRNLNGRDHESPIRFAEIELDPDRHRVTKRGKAIHLTPKEFELLHYLMLHAGEPIPHKRLLNAIWGPQYGGELEYLRTFMRSLRKKVEDDPSNPKYLLTDAYFGYRFNEDEG